MGSILYIENNEDDIALVKVVFRRFCPNVLVGVAKSVNSAKEVLLVASHPACSLILLDYNLDCGEKGTDFLKWLRSHPFLRSIPVVMYSGGEPGAVVAECYRAGADYFIHKPIDFAELKQFAACLNEALASKPPRLEPLRDLPIHSSRVKPELDAVPPSGRDAVLRQALG